MVEGDYAVVQEGTKQASLVDWYQVTLGEILSFSNGASSPKRSDNLPHPVYGSNGIIGFSDETNASSNVVVIGRVGSYCGSLHFSDRPCWITDNAIRASAVDENDAKFLYYLLHTLNLNEWRTGSGQPLLNQSILSSIPTAVPPLPEQRAIAHILGVLDDKIELNRRMNETLEEMARALFKSWFVDFEPVRSKMEGRWRRGQSLPGMPAELYDLFPDRMVSSELGEIPAGWRVGTLGNVANEVRVSAQPQSIEPGTPYIALEHMPKRCLALSDWGVADEVGSNKFRFERGNILFGKLRPYFHKVGIAPLEGVCSTDIVVVAPAGDCWFGFVLGHVSSDEFVDYTDITSTGTRMPRTKWRDMARYSISLPTRGLAEAFTAQIQPWVEQIVSAIHESRALSSLRDTLLPEIVSGKLQVTRRRKRQHD